MNRDRVDTVRRRFPMGYVLAASGLFVAIALIWTSISSAQQARNTAQSHAAILEVAVAKLRNQLSSDGITPIVPSVAQLLDGDEVAAGDGAPAKITFKLGSLPGLPNGVMLVCSDSSGFGRYSCESHAIPASASPSAPTTVDTAAK